MIRRARLQHRCKPSAHQLVLCVLVVNMFVFKISKYHDVCTFYIQPCINITYFHTFNMSLFTACINEKRTEMTVLKYKMCCLQSPCLYFGGQDSFRLVTAAAVIGLMGGGNK